MPRSSQRRFEDVASLDDSAARALLNQGDAVERVWAIWTLALRATDGANELAGRVAGEPNPGVRRALAVVLAGHEHLDLLVPLARHDPDAHVRASAMGLLVLQAQADRIPWAVITEALARESAAVRTTIVGLVGPEAPRAVREQVASCLDDIDQVVRLEAFEALLRVRVTGDDIGAPIRAWLNRSDRSELDLAFARWRRIEDQRTIMLTLVGASRSVREHFIATCERQRRTWNDLGPLVEDDLELFLQYDFDLGELQLPLLVDAVLAQDPTGYVRGDLVGEIGRRLEVGDPHVPAVADRLAAFADAVQRYLDDLRDPEDSWPPEPQYIAEVERIRDRARALAAPRPIPGNV